MSDKVSDAYAQMRSVQLALDAMREKLRSTPDDPQLLHAIRLTAGQLGDFEADYQRALAESRP